MGQDYSPGALAIKIHKGLKGQITLISLAHYKKGRLVGHA